MIKRKDSPISVEIGCKNELKILSIKVHLCAILFTYFELQLLAKYIKNQRQMSIFWSKHKTNRWTRNSLKQEIKVAKCPNLFVYKKLPVL